MNYSFIFKTDALVLSIFLFIGMIVMIIMGRFACRMWNKEESEPKGGVGSLFGALFALSGSGAEEAPKEVARDGNRDFRHKR